MKIIPLLLLFTFALITLPAQAVIIITRAAFPAWNMPMEISYIMSGGNSSASIGCGTRYCDFGIWVLHDSGTYPDIYPSRIILDGGSNGGTDTWANANKAFLHRYPASATFTTFFYPSRGPYTVCVGGAQNNMGYLFRTQPGTSCVTVPLPPQPTSCSFSGSPIIDHGSLQPNQVNGKQDSVSINVNCNRATSATLTSLGGTINLGGGVTSTLTFDGRTTGSIYLPNGNSSHTVASTLRGTNPTPGDKSGSGTIVITLP